MTEVAGPVPLDVPRRRRGPWLDLLVRLIRDKPLGAAGAAIFLAFLLCGIFADVLAPYGPNDTDLRHRLEGPSLDYLMGTDHLGRDVWSRVLIALSSPPSAIRRLMRALY